MTAESTRQLILSTAFSLIQSKGYNGFSYRDIADEIGIKTASIHYYFPKKCDLGRSLMADYRARFKDALLTIDQDTDESTKKLHQFTDLFIQTLAQGNRMCLCGMLATEISTLPEEIVKEVKGFITDTEKWLTHLLTRGCQAGSLQFAGNPEDQAKILFAALEGAMITARTLNDRRHLQNVTKQLHATMIVPNK
jgi:TetR/AcrR family transcriptional repressor of nem operon